DGHVTGVQTCALPISALPHATRRALREDEAEDDHRRRDRKREQPVDRKRQPVVEHASSPGDPGVWTLPSFETAPPGKPCTMKTRSEERRVGKEGGVRG